LRDSARAPRLEFGSHDSPDDGVCVVELASMLAGEPFSDRPDCVCPVIAAYLRGWNDRLGHRDRQRLAPYAERVIGSRSDRATTALRRDICLVAAGADLRGGPVRRALSRAAMRARILWRFGPVEALRSAEGAGSYAARISFSRDGVDDAFDLLEILLMVGSREGDARPDDRAQMFVRAELIARHSPRILIPS
jgi:hypothetical protein